jgi:NADH-quinone oxidoreductase subunit C
MSDGILFASRDEYFEVVSGLKSNGYDMCIDVTAVDYLRIPDRELPDGVEGERFEVVTNLLSMTHKTRTRIRVQVPAGDPSCPSIVSLYPGAENMEREAFDLVGVRFSGHPDLTRILMPEDWEGHPLRKDYVQGHIPIQFKHTVSARQR